MIRIQVIEKQGLIQEFVLRGHADYDEYGKDIVCAAVSATYLCTANACLSINPKSIQVASESDVQTLQVVSLDEITQKLLHNMIHCLEDLEKQYPKNIKLDKEEK